MNKRHYEHTLPNIRGSLSNTYGKYYGAAGFTYGYSTSVSRHLALEFSLGIGYLTTEYQKYTPYEGSLVWMSSGNYTFIGPTKAKISLVWLITKKRGRK